MSNLVKTMIENLQKLIEILKKNDKKYSLISYVGKQGPTDSFSIPSLNGVRHRFVERFTFILGDKIKADMSILQ